MRYALGTLLLLTTACTVVTGSGEIVTETRQVDSFDSIELRGSGDLTISIGDDVSVIVEADSAMIDRITTTVDDGRLVLDQEGGQLFGDRVAFDVTIPALEGIFLTGSGSVEAEGVEGDLTIEVSGSGDVVASGSVDGLEIDLNGSGAIDTSALTASTVSIDGEGSGDVDVAVDGSLLDVFMGGSMGISASGTATETRVAIDGSGDFTGRDLTAVSAHVDIPGSGSVQISVEDRLDVSISGSGDVTYYGNPELTENISGSGSVRKG